MKGKTRQTKYAKKANQMMDKVIGRGNREKLNKAVGSLIGEGSPPPAMVTKKTKGGAMTTGKTKSQQAKELKRQQEMRKKYGTMAPMEPVEKKALGGMAVLKAAKDAGVQPKDIGSMGVVGALRKNPDAFKRFGLGGAALSKLLKERGGEMQAKEEEVMRNPRNVPVKPGMSAAPKMMREGGKVKK